MTFQFFLNIIYVSFSQEDGDPGLVEFTCSGLGEMKESDFMHTSVVNDLWLAYFVFFQLKSLWYSINIYSIQQK